MLQLMEANVVTRFLADLVNATSDCVQAISDQCLAKGLIAESTYRKVLESGGTSDDKARILIMGVQKSTKIDSACFDILLEILDEQLPPAIKQKLILEMRKEREERVSSSLPLVPAATRAHSQQSQAELEVPGLTVTSQQYIQQQSSLVGRFGNSERRLGYISAQKSQLEEELQSRVEESSQLKDRLDTLESQFEANSLTSEKETSITKRRILACETEMKNLKRKIEELGCVIEEESMQAKRGRNAIRIGTKRLIDQVVQQSQQEIKRTKEEFMEILKNKEQAEQEATTQRVMQEDASAKLRELELKVWEQKLQIKELEQNNARLMGLEAGPGTPSLKELLKELYSHVSDKWQDIGSLLGIGQGDLSVIKANFGTNDGPCLCEVLKMWLKRASPPPSWSAIIDAMEQLGESELASQLKMKFSLYL